MPLVRISLQEEGAVQHKKIGNYLILVQISSALIVLGYRTFYRKQVEQLLLSPELIRVLSSDVVELERSVKQVDSFLLSMFIHLIIQTILVCLTKGEKRKKHLYIFLCVLGMSAFVACRDLYTFTISSNELLFVQMVTYVVPYINLCVILPMAWMMLRVIQLKKHERS